MENNNNEIEELQVICNVIDETNGNLLCRLSSCEFPMPGDKIMIRNEQYMSEYLITKRTMIIDGVEGYMCWNMFATQIGVSIPMVSKSTANTSNDDGKKKKSKKDDMLN